LRNACIQQNLKTWSIQFEIEIAEGGRAWGRRKSLIQAPASHRNDLLEAISKLWMIAKRRKRYQRGITEAA